MFRARKALDKKLADMLLSTVLLLETLLFKVHAQSVYMTSCETTLTPCMMMMKHLLVMKSRSDCRAAALVK